jgi:hypothetical protein
VVYPQKQVFIHSYPPLFHSVESIFWLFLPDYCLNMADDFCPAKQKRGATKYFVAPRLNLSIDLLDTL